MSKLHFPGIFTVFLESKVITALNNAFASNVVFVGGIFSERIRARVSSTIGGTMMLQLFGLFPGSKIQTAKWHEQ